MADKKLTVGEIKKALEHCAGLPCLCSDCILFEPEDDDCQCSRDLKLNALDLINRLQAENERLIAECGNQSTLWSKHFESIFETAKETIKAEAYKEFAEKLNAEAEKVEIDREGDFVETVNKIYNTVADWCKATSDNLLKELVGDTND